jgi:hypothetical protein
VNFPTVIQWVLLVYVQVADSFADVSKNLRTRLISLSFICFGKVYIKFFILRKLPFILLKRGKFSKIANEAIVK